MTFYKNFVHRAIKHLRDNDINTPLFMGGPYPTGAYEDVLKDDNIDICILGEGENTLSELVNEMIENYNNLPSEEILSKIPGMAFKSKEKFLKKIIKEKEFKNIAEQVA